jgi:hypothetical protein
MSCSKDCDHYEFIPALVPASRPSRVLISNWVALVHALPLALLPLSAPPAGAKGADIVDQLLACDLTRLAVAGEGGQVAHGVPAVYSSSISGYWGGALPWVVTSRG